MVEECSCFVVVDGVEYCVKCVISKQCRVECEFVVECCDADVRVDLFEFACECSCFEVADAVVVEYLSVEVCCFYAVEVYEGDAAYVVHGELLCFLYAEGACADDEDVVVAEINGGQNCLTFACESLL